MTQQETAIIIDATSSEVENVPGIQSLALRVEELSRSVDFWNQLMIWSLLVAAIAAGFIVVATRKVVSRSGELSTAQDSLREAKDRQLQIQLAGANKATEDERMARTQLEALIAPRRLDLKQQVKIAENCKGFKSLFAGKRVKVVSYSLDTESFVLAEQIVKALRDSGMVVDDDAMSITPMMGTIVFGIQVFPDIGSKPELAKKIAEAIGSSGKTVAVSFTQNDPTAGAMRVETANSRLPHEATILVGLKMPDADTIKELNRITPATRPAKP